MKQYNQKHSPKGSAEKAGRIALAVLVLSVGLLTAGCVSSGGPAGNGDFKAEGGVISRSNIEEAVEIILPEKIGGETVVALKGRVFVENELLEVIHLPSGLTKIDPEAFWDCPQLRSFTVAEWNSAFTVVDDVLFSKDKKTLVAYPPAKEGREYTVPEGVERIADRAFAADTKTNALYSIRLPASLREIDIGEDVFNARTELMSIYVDEENPKFRSLDGVLYDKNITRLLKYPQNRRIEDGEYLVPEGVTRIGEGACQILPLGIERVVLPATLTTIERGAFSSSGHLKEINLPARLESISNLAFGLCVNLEPPELPDGLKVIGGMAFYGDFKHEEIYIPASVEKIGRWAYSYGDLGLIRCAADKKPDGWHDEWTGAHVEWEAEREEK